MANIKEVEIKASQEAKLALEQATNKGMAIANNDELDWRNNREYLPSPVQPKFMTQSNNYY